MNRSFALTVVFFLSALRASIAGGDPATDPSLTPRQREVITYFKEVALGFEYGTATGITRKWKVPMKVFVAGNPSPVVEAEVDSVIMELNSLITDGFQVSRTDRKEDSNFVIHFATRAEFTALSPIDASNVRVSSGLFRIYWDKSNYINRGYAFIHNAVSETEQRHAVREELTQALGLGKDSLLYPESIFQSKWATPTEFADIDRQLIRCLYHPSMKVGLNQDEVELVLTEILLSEHSTL